MRIVKRKILPSASIFAVRKIVKRLQNSACRAFEHYAPMFKEFEEAGLVVQNSAA